MINPKLGMERGLCLAEGYRPCATSTSVANLSGVIGSSLMLTPSGASASSTAETGDQGDKQLFVAGIVRDVEEGVLRGVSLGDRSGPARRPPPRSATLLRLAGALTDQGIRDHGSELTIALR